jgi:hypothetical protein
MSVFYVVQWTAIRERLPELQQALTRLQEHVRLEHPSVRSTRSFRVQWGGEPARPGFIWMEEFESLTAIDESDRLESTPACDEVWAAVYACAVAGTIMTGLWRSEGQEEWFTR